MGDGGWVFPWKSVWVPEIPTKVAFFMWTVALGRNLTLDNLMRRGHILVYRCCMCCADAESVNHLFLHCSVASRLWGFVCSLFGLAWVQPQGVSAFLWAWRGVRLGRRQRRAWLLVPFCLMWLL
ncbi:hypothetical protein CsSME_00048157 [Camellia sinensis var. sinensis]